MAVRQILYTVSADGISPAVKQFGGVQGEHKATEIVFNIESTLYDKITAQSKSDGDKLIYRFDGYNAEGGVCRSDTNDLTEAQVTYQLEEWITSLGGMVKVVLVISLLKDDLTEMELFSFPALLQLKNLPEDVGKSGKEYKSISTLAQISKDSANTAVLSANKAIEAKEKTELAKSALEGGTMWVFDGGNAAGDVDADGDGKSDFNTADIKFVVDKIMSDYSYNAIANVIVKKYIDDEIKKAKIEAKLEAHPIGSYYWSANNTNPSELFGGTWEKVEGKFILAASDTYEVGSTGGEAEHTLKIEEMPNHWHKTVVMLQEMICRVSVYQTNAVGGDGWALASHSGGVDDREYQPGDLYSASEGESMPHNNMPPYEVAYCWKRIA